MTYLIDTHVLIWAIIDPSKLSVAVRKIIEDPENTIQVSAISFWEISLKFSLNKMDLKGVLPEEFPNLALRTGFELIPLLPDEGASYHQLEAGWHKDPFDKMLIWQAIKHKTVLISKDKNIAKYHSIGLKVIW